MAVSNWKEFFHAWPADLPRRALLITAWNEQIPFDGFVTSEAFLLVCRQTPDSLGARMVVLTFDQVSAVKMTEVVRPKALQPLGFVGTLPSR